MRIVIIILRRFAGVAAAIRRRWYRTRFQLSAALSLKQLSVGVGTFMLVPVRVGGGMGTLKVGSRCMLGFPNAPRYGAGDVLLEPRSAESVIAIGDGTYISNNTSLIAMKSIRIGNDCRIGDRVSIFDCDFHEVDVERRDEGTGHVEPVVLGDRVWLGSGVMILRGVTVGDNTVVGAGSVVTRSLPSNSVAAGVPAKVIRSLCT